MKKFNKTYYNSYSLSGRKLKYYMSIRNPEVLLAKKIRHILSNSWGKFLVFNNSDSRYSINIGL